MDETIAVLPDHVHKLSQLACCWEPVAAVGRWQLNGTSPHWCVSIEWRFDDFETGGLDWG